MGYDKIPLKKHESITVSGFNGGINCSKIDKGIGDNQLKDAVNMWWYDNALCTRPGIKPLLSTFYNTKDKTLVKSIGGINEIPTSNGSRRRLARIYKRYNGISYVYDAVMSTIGYDGSEQRNFIKTNISESEYSGFFMAESGGGSWDGTKDGGAIAFIGRGGDSYHGQILAQPSFDDSEWVDVTDKAYIPLIMINGGGSYDRHSAEHTGTLYEGFNLLTPKFRALFTTDGENSRFYFLPVKQLDDTDIIVNFTDEYGYLFSYTIPAGKEKSDADKWDMAVHVNRAGGYIYYVQDSNNTIRWFPSIGIKNNLEIIASKAKNSGRDKICSMSICTWFGGDISKDKCGTRLFVSGNPKYPNLMHWSDVNNPLYFPENNYAFIGDSNQKITALAKQGNKLIIFKEFETYYASYTLGSRSSKYHLDGTVIDATYNAALFPVSQLHSTIGCDCPNTIQLCDNRLIWACSSKKVYVLVNSNEYSECNIKVISESISEKFTKIDPFHFKSACSGDYCRHYVLLIENNIFLFDYTNGTYLQNTSKSNMQTTIPWLNWKFDFCFEPIFLMANEEKIIISGRVQNSYVSGIFNALLCDKVDNRIKLQKDCISTEPIPIEFMIQTKLYDFEKPEFYKNIFRLYLELNKSGNPEIYSIYLNELGEISEAVPLEILSSDNLICLNPNAVRVRCFGLRLQGIGMISLGGLTIKYSVMGKGIR